MTAFGEAVEDRLGNVFEALWWWQFSYVSSWGNLAGAARAQAHERALPVGQGAEPGLFQTPEKFLDRNAERRGALTDELTLRHPGHRFGEVLAGDHAVRFVDQSYV